jgi:hypothetical protein
VWNTEAPPKIQLFLWLLSHNRLATVDNLNKKGLNKQCCFYNENETNVHLCLECVIAKVIWKYVKEFIGSDIGIEFITVASKWLNKDKFYAA